MNKRIIKRNNLKKRIFEVSNTKECFYYGRGTCNGKIVKAHTLQNNGILNLIVENINSSKLLYSFGDFDHSQESLLKKLKPIGAKTTSIFTGFCKNHDDIIFKPIENGNEFNLDNEEHCFLQSYRNFARFYYRHLQAKKIFENNDFQRKVLETTEIDKQGFYIDLKEKFKHLVKIKTKLNTILTNKDFSKLKYFRHEIDNQIKLATSTIYFVPKSNSSILAISVFPKINKTIIIIAALNDDNIAVEYLNKIIKSQESKQFYLILSFLLINTSTILAPSTWNNIDTINQKIIIEMLSNNPLILKFQESLFSPSFQMYNLFKN